MCFRFKCLSCSFRIPKDAADGFKGNLYAFLGDLVVGDGAHPPRVHTQETNAACVCRGRQSLGGDTVRGRVTGEVDEVRCGLGAMVHESRRGRGGRVMEGLGEGTGDRKGRGRGRSIAR